MGRLFETGRSGRRDTNQRKSSRCARGWDELELLGVWLTVAGKKSSVLSLSEVMLQVDSWQNKLSGGAGTDGLWRCLAEVDIAWHSLGDRHLVWGWTSKAWHSSVNWRQH